MSNGQYTQKTPMMPNSTSFGSAITEGEGTNPENAISTTTESIYEDKSWQRSPQEIGSKLLDFSGNNSEMTYSQGQSDTISQTISQGISHATSANQPSKGEAITYSFDQSVIKTTDGGLAPAAIAEAEKQEKTKLDKEDNAEDYYEIMRDMARVNTDNSYGANSAYNESTFSDRGDIK